MFSDSSQFDASIPLFSIPEFWPAAETAGPPWVEIYKDIGYAPGYALGYAPMICAEDGGMRQLDMRHSQKSTALPGFVFAVVGYAPGMR